MFGLASAITIRTLWYSLAFLVMMLLGGAMYEQRIYSKKHDGKKMQTLAVAGWMIIFMAMLGFVHGILSIFHMILPL